MAVLQQAAAPLLRRGDIEVIDRRYETMTSKERVVLAINHEEPDRVPVNYQTNPAIDARLKSHLGLQHDDDEGLYEILGVDLRSMYPQYTGAPLHTCDREDRRVDPLYGWVTRYVNNNYGGYWDFCDFPLRDADEEAVSQWKMPDPDDFDYDELIKQAKAKKSYALHLGNSGLACIMNTAGFLRGMEQVFYDLATDDPAGLLLIDRIMESQFKKFERELDKVGKLVDLVWIGEDLGTQRAPLITREMLHKYIFPWHKKFIDVASCFDLPVMMHTCGSSSWAYEDYIAAGLKGVETLQPEVAGMSPGYLKDTFGGRLFFHGCISTTGPLAFGTKDDVINDVREKLEIMMPGGGYILSPTHQIQDNTPPENIIAMYATAHDYGRYRK